MKKTNLLVLAAIIALSGDAIAADKVVLPWGHDKAWTGKVIFNPDGAFNVESNNGLWFRQSWPGLCVAKPGDIYSFTLPLPTGSTSNGRIEFRTPIDINMQHTYSVGVTIESNKALNNLRLIVDDPDVVNSRMLNMTINGVAAGSHDYVYPSLSPRVVNSLCLTLGFDTREPATDIKISGISVRDEVTGEDLWEGTCYYNYISYTDASTSKRLAEPRISGRTPLQTWTYADYDDSAWTSAPMPVGNYGYNPAPNTIWPSSEFSNYWIRRDFELTDVDPTAEYYLLTSHDDTYEVYVNGMFIDSDPYWTGGYDYVTSIVPGRLLRKGRNVIACYIQNNGGGCFFDCSLTARPGVYEAADFDTSIADLIPTEVTVANIDRTIDFSNNYGGWVELYNPTDKRISLDLIYASNDPNDLTMSRLSTFGSVAPHDYVCLFFDHDATDGAYGPGAIKQISFKLTTDGGTLYLSEDGVTPLLTIPYPAAKTRCSYARKSIDSDEWGYNALPTPYADNSPLFADTRLEAPTVDTDSHLFDSPFFINVSAPAGATIKYTVDGAAPGIDHGEVLTDGKIHVTKTQVYRFCAVADGYLPSTVTTRTFIHRDKNYYLPVVAVSTDPKNLYDDYLGVYVDGKNGEEGRNHGKSNINMDWERPVNFEFITADGRMALNHEANFQVSGGWSRHYHPTSFKIKANKIYEGLNSLDYPFFRYKPFNKYKQIVVRNGGNDNDSWWKGRVRDAITQQVLISSGFYVDAQDYQPSHVFFNGSYIGMLNIREPNNRFHGTANYGYDDDLMDAFEYSNGYFQMAGTKDAFNDVVTLSYSADNDAIYESIRDKIDMDEFINYMAAITYIGCGDWIGNSNNSKGYRSLPDGKFHFVVMDLDAGWSHNKGVAVLNNNYVNELLTMYNNLKINDQFRRQFVDSYCILNGSVFTPERIEAIGDSICRLVEPALAFENRNPWNSFNEQRNNMIANDWRRSRMEGLRECYGLGEGMNARISANIPQASLMINRQPIPTNRFDGTLFTPVTLTAAAPAGYRFLGWHCIDESSEKLIARESEWRYYDRGSLDGIAWKSPDYTDSSWSSGKAPLGYHTDVTRDYNTTLYYGPSTTRKYPCYYFRKEFNLENEPMADQTFTLNFTADDGFIVYINGKEAYRYLMPDGDVTFSTYATTFAPNNPDTGSFRIPNELLRQGRNVIAVEVHNNSATSTDIYWAAELTASGLSGNIVATGNMLYLENDAPGSYTAMFEPVGSEAEMIECGGTPVRINEISAGNDIYVNELIKRDDWIELYNTTDHDIDVAGMYLSDNEKKPTKFKIEASEGINTIIPAHGYLLVWASKREARSMIHASFKLGNDDGSVVTLQAADGSWTDVFHYDAHDSKETYGRYPDGGNAIYRMTIPTIMRRNMLSTYDFELEDLTFDNQAPDDGVEAVGINDSEEVEVIFYDLHGRLVAKPSHGIFIRRAILSDGTVKVTKIAR